MTVPRIGSIATTNDGGVSPSRVTIGFLPMLLVEQLTSVALPEEERLKLLPYLLIPPMLAKDISRVYLSRNVVELHHPTCNSLSNSVIRKHCVPLMELCVR